MKKRKFRRFSEGGLTEKDMSDLAADSADKAAGLEASNKDVNSSSPLRNLIDRFRMGNIDDPNSEAYKRLGAGRGRASRVPVEDRVGTPVAEIRARDKPVSDAQKDAAVAQGKKQPSGDASVAEAYSGPRKEPVKTTNDAPVKKPVEDKKPVEVKKPVVAAAPVKKPVEVKKPVSASDSAAPRKSAVDMIPTGGYRKVEGGEKINSSELGRNVNNALNAVVPGPARGFAAAKSAAKSGSRALKEIEKKDTPLTYLGKSGRRQVSGYGEIGTARKAIGTEKKAIGNEPLKLGMKKGGAVKKPVARYASGGSVGSASKRGDGIATKGKTKGRML